MVLALATLVLLQRRQWGGLIRMVAMVPGGLLLGECLKLLSHRHRPYTSGPFVDWSGYSFPSGHTIGATLLLGGFLIAAFPLLQRRRWRLLAALGEAC